MPRRTNTPDDNTPDHPNEGKLIDLQGHHAAEHLLDLLLAVDRRSPEYHRLAGKGVALGPPLLAALVRRLDSAHPSRLTVLGRLAATYPARTDAVRAIARAAADRRHADARRFGALLVLTQYLGVPPVEDFLATLHSPAGTAAATLVGALAECYSEPETLRDYISSLLSQPPEVLFAVLHALRELPGDMSVSALRLLALQPEPEIMQGAIDALNERLTLASARSLAVLEHNLPSEASRLVGRMMNKLRLSGHGSRLSGPAVSRCRALLSPIDGQGRRLMWLVVPGSGQNSRTDIYLGLVIGDSGITGSTVLPDEPENGLPPVSAPGTLHPASRHHPALLEVPFGAALHTLKDAVARNWEAGLHLPIYYQLYLGEVWRFAASLQEAEMPAAHQAVLDIAPESESDLLHNALFDGWYLETGGIQLAAQSLLDQDVGLPTELTDESWRALLPVVIRLARSEFNSEVRQRYSSRLEQMSQWLMLAGREDEAALCRVTSRVVLTSPPEASLFVLSLVQKGLLIALDNLMPDQNKSSRK